MDKQTDRQTYRQVGSLQIHHKRETRYRYTTIDNRPDITVYDIGAGSSTDLDISLAHPWSSEVIFSSASTEGLLHHGENTQNLRDTV